MAEAGILIMGVNMQAKINLLSWEKYGGQPYNFYKIKWGQI
jgi:hypothetical protein